MLPIEHAHPDCVLASGEESGFRWRVLHNIIAYRCGYVAVPKGHPWHGKEYDFIRATVHGGLTYSKTGTEGEWWVGFDCAHSGDAPDPDLPGYSYDSPGEVRDTPYVQLQCEQLCRQAAKAATEPTEAASE